MSIRNKQCGLLVIIAFFLSIPLFANIRLPKLISDGMVLQRETNVRIWGYAADRENVSIAFHDSVYQTAANDIGNWEVKLAPLKAGGPYPMTLKGSNTIVIKNILIGDVWLCSGQSNMELPMRRVSTLYEKDIEMSENASIRFFTVPQQYNFNSPQRDLPSGQWQSASPNTVPGFSAIAYFFAKELFDKYKVPVGILHSSLGGSPAEAWISEDALKAFPPYYSEAQRFKDSTLIHQIESEDKARIQAWYTMLRQKDEGFRNLQQPWYNPRVSVSDWDSMVIPGYWATTGLGAVNGVVWFRKDVQVPASMIGLPAKLILGTIVDADSVFINGVLVGTTSYMYPPRRYDASQNLLHAGMNTIVIRVISNSGRGGFVPDKTYALTDGKTTVNLQGNWKYKLGATMQPLAGQTFIRWKPVGLYNAMIAPLTNYNIKGVVWYQGESNTNRPGEYKDLFSALILDWRSKWNRKDLPFLFVQLANFMEARAQPSNSNWALLREAQLKTLSVPNTAMAVTIDVGEWNDIHPLHKKEVSQRLALAAQHLADGNEKVVYSGPLFQSMSKEGSKLSLTFQNTGAGLFAKGSDTLRYFAVAGADKHFVWARAEIQAGKVIVWNDSVPIPVAVRYAWADNPEGANLYNLEGLPASPFRTDGW